MDAEPSSTAIRRLVSAGVVPSDPVPWLVASAEPAARWLALTGLLGRGSGDEAVDAAHAQVRSDPAVAALIGALPEQLSDDLAGHHSPLFLPNRLNLLADMGVSAGDDLKVDALLDALLEHQDRSGRLRAPGATRPKPGLGSLLCDTNAIVDVLLRFGLGQKPGVRRAVTRLIADVSMTPQGEGWCCVPERRGLLGGFGPVPDACPQITLEGLRVISHLPPDRRPRTTLALARTPLEVWRRRAEERPYEFGHGYQFKTVKWPSFWYDVLAVVDAVGRFPELWSGPEARAEDRTSIAELAASLVAFNLDAEGRVVPARVHRGYEAFSFGRKGEPSPFATALVYRAVARVAELADKIAAVDIEALAGSRPSGKRRSDDERPGRASPAACPVPARRAYDVGRILPRVFARHNLDIAWEPRSVESVVSDVVALGAGHPATPYLSLAARLPGFDPAALDSALDERHSLVRLRCMRGQLYVVRRDLVPIVHAASSKQVVRFARQFAEKHGVSAVAYERLAPRILEACREEPRTRRELRERLRPDVDLAAVVTLMCAERLLVHGSARDGRFGRDTAFLPFADLLPEIDLTRLDQDDARPRLLRAYVRGFGPVTRQDAAWWTGMDLRRVQRSLDALEDELVEVSFEGEESPLLMHVADAEELERAAFVDPPSVVLLPANDPLLVGYANRARFIDDALRRFVFDSAGNAAPVVLIDGRIAAIWDVERGASDPSGSVLVFPTAPIEAEAATRLEARARDMGRVLLGSDGPVRFVAGMRPLPSRPIGAYAHPLR